MYKCINNSAPDYLCNLFDMGNLFVPRLNSNFMKRTFHYSGTILWNSLPPNFKINSRHRSIQKEIYRLFDVKTK